MTSPLESKELDDLDEILAELQGQMVNAPATLKAKASLLQWRTKSLLALLPAKAEYHDLNPRPFNSTDWVAGFNAALQDIRKGIRE